MSSADEFAVLVAFIAPAELDERNLSDPAWETAC